MKIEEILANFQYPLEKEEEGRLSSDILYSIEMIKEGSIVSKIMIFDLEHNHPQLLNSKFYLIGRIPSPPLISTKDIIYNYEFEDEVNVLKDPIITLEHQSVFVQINNHDIGQ